MKASIHEILDRLKRGMPTEHASVVDRFVARPEVQQFLDADERDQVAQRAAKIARIKAIPAEHAKAINSAVRQVEVADQRVRDAEAALQAAVDDRLAAHQRRLAAVQPPGSEVARLTAELERQCDPRLPTAFDILVNIQRNGVAEKFKASETPRIAQDEKGLLFYVLDSNVAECQAAIVALGVAMDRCQEMKLEALSRGDVEKALRSIFAELEAPLGALRILPPHIVDGDVLQRFVPTPVEA